MTTLKVGVLLADAAGRVTPASAITTGVLDAEQLGLDSLWVSDHLAVPGLATLDAPSIVAAAAALTSKLEVGLAVFVPSLRSAAWAAKQVATMSGLTAPRRLQLGVGTGGGPASEFVAAGTSTARRGERTDEFLANLPRPMAGELVAVTDRTPQWQPQPAAPMPAVWVAGHSHRALRRAARFADGWLPGLLTPAELVQAARLLNDLTAPGRTPPRIGLVVHVVVTADREAAERRIRRLAAAYDVPMDRARHVIATGNMAQITTRLMEYADVGVEHFVVVDDSEDIRQANEHTAQLRRGLT